MIRKRWSCPVMEYGNDSTQRRSIGAGNDALPAENPNLTAKASDDLGTLWISQITSARSTSLTRVSFQFVIAIRVNAG